MNAEALKTASLITIGGRAYPNYGQVLMLAGGAGSGKGFQLQNVIGLRGKVLDVDNFKKGTENVSYSGVMMEDANGSNTSGNTKYNSNQSVSYTKDKGYSDHFPVVTTFEWTKTVPAAQ